MSDEYVDDVPQELGMTRLSRTIQSVEQVAAMGFAELEQSLAAHEYEIICLLGAIEGERVMSVPRARQAERILRLHKSWVERELGARRHNEEVQAARLEKEARAQAHQQTVARLQAEKTARIAASSDEDRRQIAVFKAVALEVLGAEKYLELWNLARGRMTATS